MKGKLTLEALVKYK